MNAERRPIKDRSMLFYTVGRSYLLELYHSDLQSGQVRIVDGPATRRAAWAARHAHLRAWVNTASSARRPRKPRQTFGWAAFT
jgi:hypothetical protein